MIGQWTRFSSRLLFVVAMVVAAYASGRATMDRRAQVAEADAASARAIAIQLEARLRTAQIEQAASLRRRLASDWSADRGAMVNSRWIVNTMAINEDQQAAHLDALGIKLIGLSDDGASFKVVSEFAIGPNVTTCDTVPLGFVLIEATDLDQLILVRAGIDTSMSGMARLLPIRLADKLVQAEATYTAAAGISVSDLDRTWFSVDQRPGSDHRVVVTATRLAGKNNAPRSAFATPVIPTKPVVGALLPSSVQTASETEMCVDGSVSQSEVPE